MKLKLIVVPVLMLFFALYIHSNAWALVTNTTDNNLDFHLNNPGARANAMGGAFIGLADDATAAYANPAGLTILTQPEASLEFKSSDYTAIVHHENGDKEKTDDNVSGVSFLSFVKPLKNTTFSLYRHELLNLESNYKTTHITSLGGIKIDYDSELDIKAITYGIGIGLKLFESLSFGLSVGFCQLDYNYKIDSFNQSISTLTTEAWVESSATSEQYITALMWNPLADLNIGIVYRYGPEFNTQYRGIDGTKQKNTLNVPDLKGIGVSYRFLSCLTIAADVNRVMYSDLLEDYTYYDTDASGLKWFKNDNEFKVNDATEVHAGLEYVFSINDIPFALRGGYNHRPEHTIYYTGDIASYKATRKKGEDDDIYSFGFGTVLSDNIQIDMSGSKGDYVKDFIVSLVYRIN